MRAFEPARTGPHEKRKQMAKAARKGNHVVLDDVRVFYDYKTDSVSITSGDRDLRYGLEVHLPRGSNEERTLRDLLKSKGVLRGDPWPKLERSKLEAEVFDSEERQFVVGTNINGSLVTVDIQRNGSIWVHGRTGTGSSMVNRLAVAHAVASEWDIYGLDANGVELSAYKALPTSRSFSSGLQESMAILEKLHELVLERYAKLEELGLGDYLDMSEVSRWRPTVVMVDSLSAFLSQEKLESTEDRSRFTEVLTQIATLGRQAGIHLIIRGGDNTPTELDELAYASTHVVTGNYPKDSLPRAVAEGYKPGRGRGRTQAFVFNNIFGFNGELEQIYIPEEAVQVMADQMK
jgi:hypothetical protein